MMRNAALSLAILVLIGAISLSPNSPTVSAQSSTTVTLAASGDTYLKGGTPNTNEGASTFVRVQQSGPNRALIRFSQSEIQAAVDGGILVSAKMRMTIIDNGNNWGTTGRTVDVHRVLVDWTEGNGLNGEGVTWNCPKDTNIANQVPDGPLWKDLGPPYKDGGSYVVTPTSTSTITNGMSGVVEWTVTADVAAFLAGTSNYGWIIRKTDEGSPGRVDFASKENGVTNNQPQLVITYTSPPISKIVFTTSPQTLTAGVPSAVMTIQTQDANGNPANVASDTTIAPSSTSLGGKFSPSTSPWSDAVSLTISAGSNSVSFYYRDTVAGTPTITAAENPSEGWIDATQQETVNPAALEHFDFSPISSPQTSGVAFTITITSKDVYGNTVTSYAGPNTLSDSTGTIDPTATDIFSSGVWTGSATVTKAQAGVIITTTGNGKSGTSNPFDASPAGSNKLVITVYPPSVTVGSWTSKYIVQRQDQYGNPATSGLITVNLESSSTGNAKRFALTPDGATVTSVTIQDGFSTSEFYYYDEKSGTWMISVSATDVTGYGKPLTVNVASLDHIVVCPDPETVTAGASVTYTAVAYDVYGNSRGDVSTSTSWSIDPAADGSWSANLYTSANAGTWTVTGTHSGKSDTASLTVSLVPSVDAATGTGRSYFSPDAGVIGSLTAVSEWLLPSAGKPSLKFPHGFFSFKITGLAPGSTATVTITLPSTVPVGTQYWKYGPTPTDLADHWYQLPIGDDDGDNVITITLTDNGLGDDILTGMDSQVVDKGGPGVPPRASAPGLGHIPQLVSSASVTQTGQDVVVDLPRVGSLTFSNVGGTGTVNVYSESGLNLVGGHIPAWEAMRFTSNVEFSGPITISLDFAAEEGRSPSEYHLYQWNGNAWVDVTTSVTAGGPRWGTVTGTTDKLGIFMIGDLSLGSAGSLRPRPLEEGVGVGYLPIPELVPQYARTSVDVGVIPAIGLMFLAFAGAASWWGGLKTVIPHSQRRARRRSRRIT